ncbi:MAG: class I SAM-dependent methyltransferase, partial [Betaproteobacteria bacterium]
FAWQFARGKLGGDPAFRALLERRLVRDGTLLDLGCGQGLLAAWLLAARDRFETGSREDDRPVPPRLAAITGIELLPAEVRRARRALGSRAEFVVGDIRTTAFPRADTVAILDVLHYIPIAEQDAVLRRVRAALNPSGVLLLRIGDAGAGFGFRYSNWVDRSVMLVKGHGWNPLYCRSLAEWKTALAQLGFDVESQPMSEGTPFANVLLVART